MKQKLIRLSQRYVTALRAHLQPGTRASLQPALAGWRFQIGAWKEKTYLPVLDDLKASEPDKPAP